MSSRRTKHGTVRLAGIMKQVFMVLLLGVVYVEGDDCENSEHLIFKAEMCLSPLAAPSNATMFGGLNPQAWKNSCTLYNMTLKCIENVFDGCPEEAIELEITETIVNALRDGMGQLCDNPDTYKRYLQHAKCYAGQEMGTVRCLNTFLDAINYHLRPGSSEEDLAKTTQGMCRSFTGLIECVNIIIGTNCGDDALALFENLVKVQVPSHVTAVCYSPEKTEAPSNASRRMSTMTIIQLVTFLLCHRFS